jgi:hypothetical protein
MKKFGFVVFFGLIGTLFFSSCKNKEFSTLKVYVKSSSNVSMPGTRVVIVADISANDSKIEYVDTLISNSEGYAEFNLGDYYSAAGKSIDIANFDIFCKTETTSGSGNVRTRVHTTSVEKVYLN